MDWFYVLAIIYIFARKIRNANIDHLQTLKCSVIEFTPSIYSHLRIKLNYYLGENEERNDHSVRPLIKIK